MGIMSFLRNRAGIIIVLVIGLAIVAFLVSDAVRLGSPFWAAQQNVLGEVAGETIDIQAFNAKVEQNTTNFKQQMGGNLNDQMIAYVQENTWNQEVSSILMEKEVTRLGLTVSKNELNDMVTGKNPDPQIIQNFGDPATGQLNRVQLNQFIANIDTQDPAAPVRQQWANFLVGLKQNRLSQKYNNLVKNSIYVTSLEAREDYLQRNKLASFNYIMLPYSSISDMEAKITDEDYKNYYNENKAKFKNQEETRSFEYVVFDANASKADSIEIKTRVDKLAADFKTSANDSLFVSINADTKTPVSYMRKGQLDPALDSLVFKATAGSIVGPVFSNGAYKLAKVIDQRTSPDSVKASHILLNPAAEGGIDKAKKKADSIATLIRNGASFADLAKKFGTDASKDKGGDLGTFARGAMIPQFEEAVFNGKPGDLKVLTTQYGVHVIHIDSQKGSSRVAKVAVVDKALVSSNKTLQEAYARASAFLSAVGSSKEFDAAAQKSGLVKLVAQNVTGSQAYIQGLENPRKVIRWAFSAEEGDVSDEVFELNNKYVVARLTDVLEKGTLPVDKVKKQIEPMVRNSVKARILTQKFDKALSGASSINQIAQNLKVAVTPVQNIVFANPIIPGLSQENEVVGTVFGLQPNKLSKVIKGQQGVYVVSVTGFSNPAPLTNPIKQKQQIAQNMAQRIQTEVFKVLRDKADLKDNRAKFF